MFRFLLSLRWIGFAIFVIMLAGVCTRLGFWQIHKLDHRLDQNKIVSKHFKADPVPLDSVLSVHDKQVEDDQWTRVTATGTYDVSKQVTVRFATRDAAPGALVVTPLVLDSGAAILIDRGWLATDNNSAKPTDVPPPPTGEVTVQGWLRADNGATGQPITPTDGQVRAISSLGMASHVPYDLYRGYLNLRSQTPPGAEGLAPEPKPELGQGPHFFYALQWWFFALLAVFGWFYFAWIEERDRRKAVALAQHREQHPAQR